MLTQNKRQINNRPSESALEISDVTDYSAEIYFPGRLLPAKLTVPAPRGPFSGLRK